VKREERFGQAERVWVMDRGMVSEKNIEFLRSRKALYIVGTPKSQLRLFEAELAEEEHWTVGLKWNKPHARFAQDPKTQRWKRMK